jgi:hypothetical protein
VLPRARVSRCHDDGESKSLIGTALDLGAGGKSRRVIGVARRDARQDAPLSDSGQLN